MDISSIINIMVDLTLMWYTKLKPIKISNANSINIPNLEQWIINKIKPYSTFESIYLLPEPFLTKVSSDEIIEDGANIINKYFNSNKFLDVYTNTYNDMWSPVIQLSIDIFNWVSFTQYEIIQIVEVNMA